MKKRYLSHLPRVLALVLALMMLSACAFPFDFGFGKAGDDASNYADGALPKTRRTVPYSQMKYERPDVEELKAAVASLTEELKNAASFEDVLRIDDECTALYENFYTMRTLAMLQKYHDVTDEYYEEEYRFLDEVSEDLSLLGVDFNTQLVEGPFAEDYRKHVGDYAFTSLQNDVLMSSESVVAYKKERNSLNADYNKLLATLTVTYEGKEYTLDDIYEVDSQSLYSQLIYEYYAGNAPQFAEMYARMVELDKMTAYELGFDSPATMYYIIYGRDYAPGNALQMCDYSKTYFRPVFEQTYSRYNSGTVDMDDAFAAMPGALEKVDPELKEAWDFLQKYGLYDCEPQANKQSGIAFQTEIYDYDAPFIYSYWDDSFRSASTIMHEFGHFYDSWLHYDDDVVFNLDLAETYSQGLELLMQPMFGEFTDFYDQAVMEHIQNFIINVLLYQCLLEEFQLKVYELDTFDANVIGQLYGELSEEYGFGANDFDGNGTDHTWFTVTHLFDSPFYTISYVSSAVAALQIWAASQQDWEEGVQIYLDLIHQDQNQPFTTLLTNVGLKPVHDEAVLAEIAGYFCDVYGVDVSFDKPQANDTLPASDSGVAEEGEAESLPAAA